MPLTAFKKIDILKAIKISKSKVKALSETLLDFSKVFLAILIAADFAKFNVETKLFFIILFLLTFVSGIFVTR